MFMRDHYYQGEGDYCPECGELVIEERLGFYSDGSPRLRDCKCVRELEWAYVDTETLREY